MLRRVTVSDGGVYVAAMIEFEDIEAREMLKARGYKWNPTHKVWESSWGDWDTSAAEVKALMDSGFVLHVTYPEDAAAQLARLGIIETEIPITLRPFGPRQPHESRETRRFTFTAGEVDGKVQHGTIVRKNFRV